MAIWWYPAERLAVPVAAGDYCSASAAFGENGGAVDEDHVAIVAVQAEGVRARHRYVDFARSRWPQNLVVVWTAAGKSPPPPLTSILKTVPATELFWAMSDGDRAAKWACKVDSPLKK